MINVKLIHDFNEGHFDCVVAVNDSLDNFDDSLVTVQTCLNDFAKYHPKLKSNVTLIKFEAHSSKVLIFSPICSLNGDYDDSRRLYDASNAGVKKAVDLGFRKPLLVFGKLNSLPKEAWAQKNYVEITLILGALFAAYVPIEIRVDVPSREKKIDFLGLFRFDQKSVDISLGLEFGRIIARDIGGSDPERMAAPKIEEYIIKSFINSCVKVTTEHVDKSKYPLMAAVNRAASVVPRHDGRVIKLEYDSKDEVEETIFLVGKGITYDTGGLDIKAGGIMAGMHRDKCGAAAVTGFFKTLEMLKPKKLKVIGLCAFVRNSVGPEGYVADEIIISRANKRVRVGNTDAEGRMVMADLLCEAKELAVHAVNPSLFTVATLTGHVIRAYGPNYTAVLGNGLSRTKKIPQLLQEAGDILAEPVEISTIRREDLQFHRGFSEYEDILQCNNAPSSSTSRGHQSPAGFLILASGLDEHSLTSEKPLSYTHVDVAGSAGGIGALPTAAPLLMFAAKFILPKLL